MEQKFNNNRLDLQVLREFCEREGEEIAYRKGDQLERRPLKKKLELKARENRVFEHDSTFFTFRLDNRFSESCFYR